MDDADPLLQELLQLDDGDEVDSALHSSATAATASSAQVFAAQQQLGSLVQEPAPAPTQLSQAGPAVQPQPAAQQQQTVQQAGAPRQPSKLLGSGTLTVVVSILLRLLQDDPARLQQVKQLVRSAQAQGDTQDKSASTALMQRLSEVAGAEKVRQAVTLHQKMVRNQQAAAGNLGARGLPAQPAPQPAMQQQQQQPGAPPRGVSPVPPMQPARGISPAPPMQPARGVSPAPPMQPARGISPAPPQVQQPLPQAQAPGFPQQPAGGMGAPPGAFNMHLQQQLQQQGGVPPGHPGVVPGLPMGHAPSPGMYPPGSAAPPGVAVGQPPPAQLHPALSLPHHPLAQPQQPQQQPPKPKPAPAAQQKRGADGPTEEGGREAKRAKGPGGGGGGAAAREKKEKEGDMHDILDADAFIDMEQETDVLMAGLTQQRQLGTARLAKSQLLSEWRVGNEMLKQMTKAGLKRVRPECFEILQLAFQAHATRILRKAHNMARHRQDAARKLPDMVPSSDPRRGVLQIEKRERERHDRKLAAEREELLKAAQSKKADDETKEKAQKAKAELQGKQQASAANAAVAATLGGGKGAKWSKWEKWGPGGGGSGAAGGPGAAGGKKKGGKAAAKKAEEEKAAAADGGGSKPTAAAPADAGASVRFAEGTAAGDAAGGKLDRPGSSLQPSRSRAGLSALGAGGGAGGGGGEEGGDTIHLRDVVAVLERDPMYCKSPLLYSLANKI